MAKLKGLVIFFSLVTAMFAEAQYCLPQQQAGFISSPYSGGQFQHQALLAHPAAYNPQAYYFPQGNVHLSQPPFFGNGMRCMPTFMPPAGFQTSFGNQQMPQMNPMYGMLPALGDGIGKLVTGFLGRSPDSGQSYDDFLSKRGETREERSRRGRDFSSFTSPKGPTVIPDSNSAGAGAISGAIESADTSSERSPGQSEENAEERETTPVDRGETVAVTDDPEEEVVEEAPRAIVVDEDEVGPPLIVDTIEEISREEFRTDEEIPVAVPVARPVEEALEDTVDQLEEAQEAVVQLPPNLPKDCRALIKEQIQGNGPLEGAYRVMATFYQNCDVISEVMDENTVIPNLSISSEETEKKVKIRALKAEDKEAYIQNHPYLKMVKDAGKPGPNCIDILDKPPIFSYGAKPRYTENRRNINLFRDQTIRPICNYAHIDCDKSIPVTAIDCSGFIHAALRTAGLKVQKNAEALDYGTAGFVESMKSADSCLKAPAFNANDTIKGGDIITLSDHHMIMITSVNEDPLGIKKGIKAGDCQSIKRSDFQFTFMHSSAHRDMGVTHVSSQFPQASPTLLNNVLLLARETCKRHLEKSQGMKAMVKYNNPNRTLAVMRHVGDADPECKVNEPIKLEGEECVEDCLK